MGSYRKSRINEEVQKELCNILREVKDPRVSGALVSVTAVDVSTCTAREAIQSTVYCIIKTTPVQR